MQVVRINNYEIEYDPKATSEAYQKIEMGTPELCLCSFCQNYLAQREGLFPPEFIKLTKQFGINILKETEVFHMKELHQGVHLYSGWYHLVGHIKGKLHENNTWDAINDKFSFRLMNKRELAYKVFANKPLVQLESRFVLKWVLNKEMKEHIYNDIK